MVEGMKLSKNQDKKPTNHQRPSKSGKDPKSTLARRKWLPAAITPADHMYFGIDAFIKR